MELDWEKVAFIFMGLIIFSGNLFVCLLYITDRSLRTITNRFVISLAFCDILTAVVFIPLYVFETNAGRDYVSALSTFGSLFNIAALTYERYVAIVHALRYYTIMNDQKTLLLMLEVWAATILVTIFPLPWQLTMTEADYFEWLRVYVGILTCIVILVTIGITCVYIKIFKISANHMGKDHQLSISLSLDKNHPGTSIHPDTSNQAGTLIHPDTSNQTGTLIHPDTSTQAGTLINPHTSTQAGISSHAGASNQVHTSDQSAKLTQVGPSTDIQTISQSQPQAANKAGNNSRRGRLLREIKAAKIIALIFVVNTTCWLPIIIINICDVTAPSGQADYIPLKFIIASQYLYVLNSLIDPFIYAFCKRDFRNAIRKKIRNFKVNRGTLN